MWEYDRKDLERKNFVRETRINRKVLLTRSYEILGQGN